MRPCAGQLLTTPRPAVAARLLGTDDTRRDVVSRLAYGGRRCNFFGDAVRDALDPRTRKANHRCASLDERRGRDTRGQPRYGNLTARQQQNDVLRHARSCYDHLAGKLGVALADALVQQNVLRVEGSDFVLTPQGTTFLRQHNVDVSEATRRRRAFARRCLDWSERRDHLAGALGAALFATWEAQGWIARQADSRAVRLTPQPGATARLGRGMAPGCNTCRRQAAGDRSSPG